MQEETENEPNNNLKQLGTMTEKTITFTPEAQLRKGAWLLGKGLRLTGRALGRMFDSSVHRYPYAYVLAILLAATVTAFYNIGQARAERDKANKEYYELQRRTGQLPGATVQEIEAEKGARP